MRSSLNHVQAKRRIGPPSSYVGPLDVSGPNVEAILYFHSQIYEALKKQFVDLRLFVVGSRPVEAVRSLASDPSIIVTGFVQDVRPYIARASVVIAPFVSGTGVKTKVLGGDGYGKTCGRPRQSGHEGSTPLQENIFMLQTVL